MQKQEKEQTRTVLSKFEFHRVGAGSDKGLDLQVLFECLKNSSIPRRPFGTVATDDVR